MASTSKPSSSGVTTTGPEQVFESFPQFVDETEPDTETTLTAKLKRWIVGGSGSGSGTTNNASSNSSSAATAIQQAITASNSVYRQSSNVSTTGTTGRGSGAATNPQPELLNTRPSTRNHSRNSSLDKNQLDTSAKSRPPPVPLLRRPTRLAGVAPSVRVTAANSDALDFINPGPSHRSSFEDQRPMLSSSVGASTAFGSPTLSSMSESFGATALANLSSIPGFPLGRDMLDDTRSVRSMSTVARPSASVAHVIRKLRGEGLSKDYWIKDESSKECFDCQTIFTAFRRKHHCRICGQIFCSRCASNIISSARFGQQGYVRVCNLCLSVLEHGGDPIRPREAKALDATSPYLISAPLQASAEPPQSQFAASHLFPRSETPYYNPSEFDFGDTRRSETSSRARTPYSDDDEADAEEMAARGVAKASANAQLAGLNSRLSNKAFTSTAIAPFRRSLAEDDTSIPVSAQVSPSIEATMPNEPVPSVLSGGSEPRSPTTAVIPLPPLEIATNAPHKVAFNPEIHESLSPVGAPAIDSIDTDGNVSVEAETEKLSSPSRRSRHSSHRSAVLTEGSNGNLPPRLVGTPSFPVHSDLTSNPGEDIGVNDLMLRHVRKMLRQMLDSRKIPEPRIWEKVLMPLLIKVAQHTEPDLAAGDRLDVRDYVKIKKVPGGRPRESHYVDGVVFTKNVLHKKMPRQLTNPRVMLFSFPLEYQRIENQLVSIDPLIHQEKEYLYHLVQRIAAQRPHVVLVQKNVSGLALDFLMKEKIAVARNVKASSIDLVARSTQSDIIASMDRLALEPRLGRCGTWRVQTFVHPLIPGGRKTLMRFEGCAKTLGCTIVLRGASYAVLHEVKKIVEMMVLVVYGSRLESYLLRDELLIAVPSIKPEAKSRDQPIEDEKLKISEAEKENIAGGDVVANSYPPSKAQNRLLDDRDRVSHEILLSLQPFQDTALSGSPFVEYPPPYPLARLDDDDRRLHELRRLREYEETEQILSEEAASKEHVSHVSSFASLTGLNSAADTDSAANDSSITAVAAALDPHSTELQKTRHDPTSVLQTPQDLSRMTEIADAEASHADRLVAWEKHQMAKRDSLDPFKHQQLVVLETLGCIQTTRLCQPPSIRTIAFYDRSDVSLGQYIERICRDAGQPCSANGCGRPLLSHYQTWVHGGYRITIVPEAHPVALDRPELEGHIVMFGYCKTCGTRTAMTAMSPETYRLSFGKYLELSFYPDRLRRADHVCDHNGHVDHVRYIMFRSITFTISMEAIDLRNVVAPPRAIKVKPERQLQLRNEEYLLVLRKSTAFWDSIAHRIASFNYDLVQADRLEDCRAAMAELQAKCEQDRRAILKLLESTYEQAQSTNGTEMTSVRRALQNKAVDWEAEWTALEQRLVPTEKDVRRLTTVQLKKLFSVDDVSVSPERKRTAASTISLAPSIGDIDEKVEHCAETGASEPSEKSGESSMTSSVLTITPVNDSAPPPAPSSGSALNSARTSPIPEDEGGLRRRISIVTDNESDSTVCADPPSTGGSKALIPSPYAVRRQTVEDTSGAESDIGRRTPAGRRTRTGVTHLIDLFTPERSTSPTDVRNRDSTSKLSKVTESTRPTAKRSVTEKSRMKTRSSARDVMSDGDGSYARNVAVTHLSNRAALNTKHTRIPSAKPPVLSRASSLTKTLEQLKIVDPAPASPRSSRPSSPHRGQCGHRLSTSPTESRLNSRSASRSGRATPAALSRNPSYEITRSSSTRPGLSSTHTSKSSIHKGKAKDSTIRDDSSETGRSATGPSKSASRTTALGVARPTASSANKSTSIGPPRRVISHGSGRHVARIRSHFDRMTRENDRERERKFGFKKARPVGNVRSTIEVYDNALDAAKEDSDDDRGEQSSDDGADDEDDDNEDDDDPDDLKPAPSTSAIAVPSATVAASTRTKTPQLQAILPPATPPTQVPTPIYNDLAQYDGTLPLSSMAEALIQPGIDFSAVAAVLEEAQASKRDVSPSREANLASVLSETESASNAPSTFSDFPLPRMSEGESSGTERGSIIKAISSLWAYRGADFTPLEYPLASSEHIFADNPILVREDEPSSILAFALSSKAYRGKLDEQAATAARAGDPSLGEEVSTWKMTDVPADIAAVEDTLRKPEAKHFRLQFEDNSTTFFCKIFFAEQFDALRRNCGCPTQFVESLARCVKWDSSGGRSKVDFLKTKDDRFIVKEISRLEMDALLRFAPAYFDYMSDAMASGRPTLLAKIFGFYRIGLKNPTTGKTMKLDVLVTENLFYDRKLEKVFDLKGSTRNRLVQVTKDRPNEVLMDENLVEISRRNPLYVREDSKRFLQRAIVNDSKFLADLNVMDYSLVVGVDASKQELVVGIVDFIRTYTWDKRIESWVKDSAFLGGGSSKPGGPTIITPKQYKTRFCEAMDGYFLLSPDPWLTDPSLGCKPSNTNETLGQKENSTTQ